MLVCSDQTAARIDVEVKQIIASCYERAMQILTDNKEKLHELAKILLEKETITGIEFMAVLAPNQLPSSFEDEVKGEAQTEDSADKTQTETEAAAPEAQKAAVSDEADATGEDEQA